MECCLIVDYNYIDKAGYFEADDDWSLEDGYTGAYAYVFWDKKLHGKVTNSFVNGNSIETLLLLSI